MPAQLRIYTINRGSLQQFAEEWKQKVYPLRLEYGFQIPAGWVVEETNQFVWVISYEGPDTWEAREQAYYDSEKRKALDPDPARLIARPKQYFVKSVL